MRSAIPRVIELDVNMTVGSGQMGYLNIAPAGTLESNEVVTSCCLVLESGDPMVTISNPARTPTGAWFSRLTNRSSNSSTYTGKLYSTVVSL